MIIYNSGPLQRFDEIVLFPFDDHSLPLQSGVEPHLDGYHTPCGRTRIVVGLGEEGAPDERARRLLRQRPPRRRWALDVVSRPRQRIGLVRARLFRHQQVDGYNWHKPELGLVEYHGNRRNNLVDLDQGRRHVQSCVVYYDPVDPVRSRRFKMLFQSRKYDSRFAAAFSADGLTWRESPRNPVGSWLEMAGGTRHNGCYDVSGQGGPHGGGHQTLRRLSDHGNELSHWKASLIN